MLAAAQVRQLVTQRLQGVALTLGRVFEGRHHPATEAELPCWFVSIDAEEISAEGITWPAMQQHSLRVMAEGFCASVDALETTLDTLQAQALAALHATQAPYALRCVGVRRRVNEGDTLDARVGSLTLFLDATFLTLEGQPETLIL